ncbi:hypothetical protein KHA93_17645 [Bacillus sp. FJAT-49732]|uniref:Uncharacterized protein n=1 Tax=Lederbergia citrisecunda TaxID=2833583 RepID=A0A942YM90_9BACI|nr:hypothetical protein [Lederbergia citrisecunda]MBS4201452.1 hypothetical protein [Lederbergia citrisecunda]
MHCKVILQDILQVRTEWLPSIQLIGFQGRLDDQHTLFSDLNEKVNDLLTKKTANQYLVILPELISVVAIERNDVKFIPDVMTAFIIPED